MKNNQRFIKLAVEEAKKTFYRVKVGCVIFDKNKVLSKGHNDPLKSAKNLHPQFQKFKGSIHAEVDAILHAKRDLKGACMLIVRVNRFNQFRMAKPCADCMKYITKIGIKKVFYSIVGFPYFEEFRV